MNFYLRQIVGFMVRIGCQASITVFFVFLARVILDRVRMPRRYSWFLWWIPYIRLILPIQLKSTVSLLPNFNYSAVMKKIGQPVVYVDSDKMDLAASVPEAVARSEGAVSFWSEGMVSFWGVFLGVWGIGVLVLLGYGLFSVIRLKKRLRVSVQESEQVYITDHIPAAFVMGIRSARIYLPSDLPEDRKEYIICHEQQHMKRKDYIVKPIFFFITCLYWIHPLLWVAYILAGRDMEFACDEAVIQSKSFSYRQKYAEVLLKESIRSKGLSAVPLAFSKESPKKRIQHIISYKRPWVFVTIGGIAGMIVLTAALLTDPVKKTEGEAGLEGQSIAEQQMKQQLWQVMEAKIEEEKEFLIKRQESRQVTEQTAYLTDKKIEEYRGELTEIEAEKEKEYFQDRLSLEGQTEEEREDLKLKPLQIDRNRTIGTEVPRLYYVDKDRIIFGGDFGIFVYSKAEKAIVRGIDLEAIGCSVIPNQRDCQILVSLDGTVIYFHPIEISSDGTNIRVYPAGSVKWLVYSVLDHTLTIKENLHVSEKYLYQGVLEEGSMAVYRASGKENTCILSYSDTIGSISWSENGEEEYPFFGNP